MPAQVAIHCYSELLDAATRILKLMRGLCQHCSWLKVFHKSQMAFIILSLCVKCLAVDPQWEDELNNVILVGRTAKALTTPT